MSEEGEEEPPTEIGPIVVVLFIIFWLRPRRLYAEDRVCSLPYTAWSTTRKYHFYNHTFTTFYNNTFDNLPQACECA